ncbi:MAG: dihydrolipoyl dehydrogenase [Parvibaculales bacterium]
MSKNKFDVIVIGSGPGGYVAAIRASQLGLNTAIVEKADMGGVCLNWGCIPTKAMLRSSELYHQMQHAEDYGLTAKADFDLSAIVKRSRDIAGKLSGGIDYLMKKNKVAVIKGTATLSEGSGAPLVEVDGETYEAAHVILATGARPRNLEAIGLVADGETVWTSREAMVPEKMPKKMVIVGSGAIGVEFASFYASFGVEVTLLEVLDRILPQEDEEISGLARKSFEKKGITIMTGAQISATKVTAKGATITVEAGGETKDLKADKVILAAGVVANTEDMGLEALGVALEKGHIATDAYGATNVAGLYAIGDVTAPPWLAHKASHEGVICVEKLAGQSPHALERTRIPGCTYSAPQIASVGLSEAAAVDAGHDVRVGRFPFMGNGKALAMGEPDGLVKTVFDAKTGELLGAHMIGTEVTELIQGFVTAMGLESTEAELMETVFAHPTLSEMMHESVLDAYDRVLHI